MGGAAGVILGGAVAAGLAIGILAGRRPRPGPPAFRAVAFLAGGVVCETAGAEWWASVLTGYVLLLCFALIERRRPGMVLVVVGLAANLTVIAADHGMPVKGLAPAAEAGARHHGLGPGDHLGALADVIEVPGGSVMSPGDLVLCLGAAVAAFATLEPRRRSAARQAAR
jgi:hypothetical protein